MRDVFLHTKRRGADDWITVSDMMAGLMIVFLFIAIVYIRPIAELTSSWQQTRVDIYDALHDEFKDDLPRWNATIERATLTVRFREPDILFETGSNKLKPEFRNILRNFFPRYVGILDEYQGSIEELRIEGHTSSIWNKDVSTHDAYLNNMQLSHARTFSVLRYVLALRDVSAYDEWIRPKLTANGLSSSRVIKDANGNEDLVASRRVEFRVRTKIEDDVLELMDEGLR